MNPSTRAMSSRAPIAPRIGAALTALALLALAACSSTSTPASPAPTTPAPQISSPGPAASDTPPSAPTSELAPPSDAATSSAPASGGGGGLIAYVPPISGSPFFKTIECGVKDVVSTAGYDFVSQAPPKFDAGLQTQIIQALMQRNPKALIVDVVATKQLQPILSSLTSKTAVVTSLEPIDVRGQVGSVLFDQKAFGRLQADELVKSMGETGKVFLMDYQAGSQTLDDRAQGVTEELGKYPGISIVAHEYAVGDPTKAAQQTSAVLQRNPDLTGVVATDVYSTPGVINAVKAARAKVSIVSADLVPDTVRELKAGEIVAFIATKNFALGQASGQAAVDALAGKTNTIPSYVDNALLAITPDNIAQADAPEFASRTC